MQMKATVPKSKKRPVIRVLKRSIICHETSLYCHIKKEILKN
jgi:hypothetical protein